MKNFNLVYDSKAKKMKDANKTYVTGYYHDEKQNKIIVNFADGSKYSYVYTEELKQKILSKMEQQVIDASDNKQMQDYENTSDSMRGYNLGLFVGWGIPSIIAFFGLGTAMVHKCPVVEVEIISTLCYGAGGITFAKGVHMLSDYIKEKSAFKDYKKSKFFLDNKDLMNHYSLQREPILKGVSLKAKKQIEKAEGELNINNISKMSLRDLKKLKANIESLIESEEFIKSIREELEQENQPVKTK